MNRFQGGKRVGNNHYVRCGNVWIEIIALADQLKEKERYGPYAGSQ
jgi:hypothetical protein